MRIFIPRSTLSYQFCAHANAVNLNWAERMAKRLKFVCELCDKHYDFRSKYDRHLVSSGHRCLEETIHCQGDTLLTVNAIVGCDEQCFQPSSIESAPDLSVCISSEVRNLQVALANNNIIS